MNKTTIVILIVILVAGITGVTISLFNQKIEDNFISEEGTIKEFIENKIVEEDSTEKKFIDWMIYRNEENNFRFKYPSETKINIHEKWYGGEVMGESLEATIYIYTTSLDEVKEDISSSTREMNIVIFNNLNNLSLENWVNQKYLPQLTKKLKEAHGEIDFPEYRKVEIGSYSALEVADEKDRPLFPKMFVISDTEDLVAVFGDGYGYGIRKLDKSIFESIVNNFEFL